MATSTRPEELVSKPGKKSMLWDYLGLRKTAKGEILDDGQAVCRVCRKSYATKNSNTTNRCPTCEEYCGNKLAGSV